MPKAKRPSSFTSQPNRDSAQRSVQGSILTGYGLTKCNDSTNKIDAKGVIVIIGNEFKAIGRRITIEIEIVFVVPVIV